LLLVAFLLVNAPNCHLSLVLASVVQGDAVNCNTRNHQNYLHAPGCYDYRSGCLGKFLSFYGLTNVMLKWFWCGSEGRYDDFCLWDI